MDNADNAQELIDQRLEAALAARQAAAQRVNHAVVHIMCEDCGEEIPVARREHLPGVATCVECQSIREQRARGWR